ncbi:MAG: pseudouridine synthase [Bacteroidota bacterium]
MSEPKGVSLNKYIAERGYCSRRQADELLRAGRILLNGQVARPGNRAFPGDEILIDGVPLRPEDDHVYVVLNKPQGVTVTTDPRIAGNVIGFIDYPIRIFPVGRLDKFSEGLLLLTNDGDLSNKLLHARNQHEKEYRVQLHRPFDQEFLTQMATGVPILDTVTRPCQLFPEGDSSFRIILTQGLNRQIRRMVEALGHHVRKLERIRFLSLELKNLPRGHWRELKDSEIAELREIAKHSK